MPLTIVRNKLDENPSSRYFLPLIVNKFSLFQRKIGIASHRIARDAIIIHLFNVLFYFCFLPHFYQSTYLAYLTRRVRMVGIAISRILGRPSSRGSRGLRSVGKPIHARFVDRHIECRELSTDIQTYLH